ncbi:MAG: hypothetical protein HZB26_12005 [Candidatus Hydrogenedentes bacterium]|nr:hypothetical protein [Candidatus Hydrogenedentota bacterium]
MAITALELVLGAIVVGLVIAVIQSTRRQRDMAGSEQEQLNVIHEIQSGMTRLEQRVEALETLLLERPHKGDMK